MNFIPAEWIRKKRFGLEHSQPELKRWIKGYLSGEVGDEQMAAWLMAVCLNGMSAQETAWLTQEMRDSGTVLDLSDLGTSVDKHSTGGVGDKTSLLLAPLVACFDLIVPMMAGRGLAHTGGTLDKLESIKGFRVHLSTQEFRAQLKAIGVAIVGQSQEICPADRRMYALRDITGTVDSLPLICASIMSKKLAEGMQSLVLDVKYGSGAFMKTLSQAQALARALKDIGERSGKTVVALVTSMQEPLGRYVGNSLEIKECVDILKNISPVDGFKGYTQTLDLTLTLAAHMIFLGKKAPTLEHARKLAEEKLRDGSALKRWQEMCACQGADASQPLPVAKFQDVISAPGSGYIHFTDIESFGNAGVMIGAGRKHQGDTLDLSAGFEVLVQQGQRVEAQAPLFIVHHNDPSRAADARAKLFSSFEIQPEPIAATPLIAEVIA